MKKLLGILAAAIITIAVSAQSVVRGKIVDQNNKALVRASVKLKINETEFFTITGNDGTFQFNKIPDKTQGKIIVSYIGKKTKEQDVISGDSAYLIIALEDLPYFLEPLEVKAVRAADKAPFTKTEITKLQIAKSNIGQDLPFVLNQTPSVTITSDAGNGVGYTGIRIRGIDATHINVTLNGIPFNDAESAGTYFVDLPDFVSSVNTIQIQRGVGTSTNGAGAFGSTINLSTNEFHDQPYGEANNSFGSFNTWKNTIKLGSGIINDHFTIDARLSRITSDGYIDRAASNLQSYYFSTAYVNKKTSIRLNIFSGKEKTYQAWYGISPDLLKTDRTYNPAGTEMPGAPYDNQTDNYRQDHYQLFLNQSFNDRWNVSIAGFLVRGKGYYEEYKSQQSYADYGLNDTVINGDTIHTTDLVRQLWLDNYFYGQTFSLQYRRDKDEITFGGSWSKYDGKHFGKIIWAQIGIPKDAEYYHYPAAKTDVNFYTKWLHQIDPQWNLFGDIQYRHVMHRMDGFEDNPALFVKRDFDFINPKAGISYNDNGWNIYLSYAMANKEPNRDDFEAGVQQQPEKEMLHDFELGAGRKTSACNWSATIYYMLYKNQLVLTGKLNDVGNYTRVNVPNSYRLGLELQGGIVMNKWFNIAANFTMSSNKIKSFTEYLDNYDDGSQEAVQHSNTNISFSPSLIASGSLNFIPSKNLELSFISKYVGKQYLDNTQNEQRTLGAYYNQDARLIYTIKNFLFNEWNIIVQASNLFSRKYELNGAAYPYIYNNQLINDTYYYPAAIRNFMMAVNIKL